MICPADLRKDIELLLTADWPPSPRVHSLISAEARFLVARTDPYTMTANLVVEFADAFDGRGDPQWPELAEHIRRYFDLLLSRHMGHLRWRARRDPDIDHMFPANELIVTIDPGPAGWREKWGNCGGKVFAGRPAALKADLVWQRFSDFGLPFPPFEWTDSLDTADLSRTEAERLGIIPRPGSVSLLARLRRKLQSP